MGAASDEQDFVADGGLGNVGDVDHGEVHADVAADGGVAVVQDYLSAVGEMAIEAVSVADGNDGQAGGTGGLPAPVVADRRAGRDVSQGDDARLPGEHGTDRQHGCG